MGRGVADDLSDLDCELSLEADAWPAGLDLVEPLIRSAGVVVDLLHHQWPGAGATEHRRTAAVYDSGVQLDLMVWPATAWSGMHPPDTIVLHATRQVFTRAWDAARARPTVEQLREWTFLGWWSLLDAAKYLRRRSPWEARQRIEEARDAVWRLEAAAQQLPFPQYGVTALLDAEQPRLPDGVEGTATGLEPELLWEALTRCAELLDATWALAAAADDGAADAQPPALASWAFGQLLAVRAGSAVGATSPVTEESSELERPQTADADEAIRAALETLQAGGTDGFSVDDLRPNDLARITWSGGPSHIQSMIEALDRVAIGEVEYLVVRAPNGAPVSKGGIDYAAHDGAGTLWQLATHADLMSNGPRSRPGMGDGRRGGQQPPGTGSLRAFGLRIMRARIRRLGPR